MLQAEYLKKFSKAMKQKDLDRAMRIFPELIEELRKI